MAETKSEGSSEVATAAVIFLVFVFLLIFVAFIIFLLRRSLRKKRKSKYEPEEYQYEEETEFGEQQNGEEEGSEGILLCENEATDTVVSLFQFNEYDKIPKCMEMWNDGTTVHIRIGDCKTNPQLKGGGLKDTYNFHSLHFHWSFDGKSQGSIHLLNGLAFPMEAHLVHYKTKFNNLEEARTSFESDAIAVLCILFIGAGGRNDRLCPITEALQFVTNEGSRIKMDPTFKLCKLLPPNTASFFRYTGSLTDTTCQENTVWTIFDSPVVVSQMQLRMFRSVQVNPGLNRICSFGSSTRATQKVYRNRTKNLYSSEMQSTSEKLGNNDNCFKPSTSGKPPIDIAGY